MDSSSDKPSKRSAQGRKDSANTKSRTRRADPVATKSFDKDDVDGHYKGAQFYSDLEINPGSLSDFHSKRGYGQRPSKEAQFGDAPIDIERSSAVKLATRKEREDRKLSEEPIFGVASSDTIRFKHSEYASNKELYDHAVDVKKDLFEFMREQRVDLKPRKPFKLTGLKTDEKTDRTFVFEAKIGIFYLKMNERDKFLGLRIIKKCNNSAGSEFLDFLQKAAWFFNRKGMADKMADGEKILQPFSELMMYPPTLEDSDADSEFSDDGFLLGPPLGLGHQGETSIRLERRKGEREPDIITHWLRLIKMGQYPLALETWQVISHAAKHPGNAEVLAGNPKLFEMAVEEVFKLDDPQTIITSVSLVESLVRAGNTAQNLALGELIMKRMLGVLVKYTGVNLDDDQKTAEKEKKKKKMTLTTNPVIAEASVSALQSLLRDRMNVSRDTGSSTLQRLLNPLGNTLSKIRSSTKVTDPGVCKAIDTLQQQIKNIYGRA